MDDQWIQFPYKLFSEQEQCRQLRNSAYEKNYSNKTDVLSCEPYTAKSGRQNNTPKKRQTVVYVEKKCIDHISPSTFPKTTRK